MHRSVSLVGFALGICLISAGCGGGSSRTLSAKDVETCIATEVGPAGTSAEGDSESRGAFFSDQALSAARHGHGYFNVLDSTAGGDTQPFAGATHTDFVFYADPAAAQTGVADMRKALWHADNGPQVAERFGNAVVIYGTAPPARYASFVHGCLTKAGAGSPQRTQLIDLARLAAQKRREQAAQQAAGRSPSQQVSKILDDLNECVPQASDLETAADYTASNGAGSGTGPADDILDSQTGQDPYYVDRDDFFNPAKNTEIAVALFFDVKSATKAQPGLDQAVKGLQSTAAAVQIGRAIIVAGRLKSATRALFQRCIGQAEADAKQLGGPDYTGPGGRVVQTPDQGKNGFGA